MENGDKWDQCATKKRRTKDSTSVIRTNRSERALKELDKSRQGLSTGCTVSIRKLGSNGRVSKFLVCGDFGGAGRQGVRRRTAAACERTTMSVVVLLKLGKGICCCLN